MYPEVAAFRQLLETIDPRHRFTSDMARRLLLTPPLSQQIYRAA
jgi:hypothetical protein